MWHDIVSTSCCCLLYLHNAGMVVTSPCEQPALRNITKYFVPLTAAAKWYKVGISLEVQPSLLDGITYEQESTDQLRAIVVKCLQNCTTYTQALTWKSFQVIINEIQTAMQIPKFPTAGECGIFSE